MKRLFFYGFLFLTLGITLSFREEIIGFFIENTEVVSLEYKNNYYLDYNFNYVKRMDKFEIHNRQDLINLYYTIINNGNSNFDFYCPSSYKECINDIIYIANNPYYLSDVNGFVHPFNSFDIVRTYYDTFNRVKVNIIKTYTDVEIEKLSDIISSVVLNVVKDTTDEREIVKLIHDYIIGKAKYDSARADSNIIKYASNTAYGVLYEGYGVCSGYADAMALFLDYYKIPNYKISSENHVWNAVYLDGKWLHLDLTWDDPITDTGEDIVIYDYFLIDTEKLLEQDKTQHVFDSNIYSEFK